MSGGVLFWTLRCLDRFGAFKGQGLRVDLAKTQSAEPNGPVPIGAWFQADRPAAQGRGEEDEFFLPTDSSDSIDFEGPHFFVGQTGQWKVTPG